MSDPIDLDADLTLRPLRRADAGLLYTWLNDPRVLEFYEGRDRPHDMAMIQAHYLSKIGGRLSACIVYYRDEPIGYLQFYPIEDAERVEYGYAAGERIYGMDQFLGRPEMLNQGLGTRLVRGVVAYLIEELGVQRVVMDPQTWNARALRCYEKSGFKRVKRLPRHEWHEGEMRDCWLIEFVPDAK